MASDLQRVVGRFKYDESAKGGAPSEFRISGGQGHDSHLESHLDSKAVPTSARIQERPGHWPSGQRKSRKIYRKPLPQMAEG
jgi:hypothetical protein